MPTRSKATRREDHSHEERLIAWFERQIETLRERRADIDGQIKWYEAVVKINRAGLEAMRAEDAGEPVERPAGQRAPLTTLRDYIVAALRVAPEAGCTAGEVAQRVRALGYESSSKKFDGIVSHDLYLMARNKVRGIVRVGPGRFIVREMRVPPAAGNLAAHDGGG